MIKTLINLANKLDKIGMYKEAAELDTVIKQAIDELETEGLEHELRVYKLQYKECLEKFRRLEGYVKDLEEYLLQKKDPELRDFMNALYEKHFG